MILTIILLSLGYLFMGHCFYMFAEYECEVGGGNDSSLGGWFLCVFFWPAIILIVGIIRTFSKVMA